MRTVALIVPLREPQSILREAKDIVPETCLEVALELREIEVRAGSTLEQTRRVPREVDAEVEKAGRDGLGVHLHVLLGEMPAAGANEQHRDLVLQRIALLTRLHGDRPLDGVREVQLAAEDVLPRRRVRILEVGHVDLRAGVERVDHHLAVARRAGDLDPPILQIGRSGCDLPVALPHGAGLLEEVGQLARRDPLLALGSSLEQLEPPATELALERVDEIERLGCQHPGLVRAVENDARAHCRCAHAGSLDSNCASSVDPLSANVELSPPVIASSTESK